MNKFLRKLVLMFGKYIIVKMATKSNLFPFLLKRFWVRNVNRPNTSNGFIFRSNILPYRFFNTDKEFPVFSLTHAKESSPETLSVHFEDNLVSDLYYIWLRDNCQCEKCLNPETKQKMLNPNALDLKISPKSVNITEEGFLEIIWPESKNRVHQSTYDPLWLHRYVLGFNISEKSDIHDILPLPQLWRKNTLDESSMVFNFKDLINNAEDKKKLLNRLSACGIALIRDVPCKRGEVINIMKLVSVIKNTMWGPSYEITREPVQSDIKQPAFTGQKLDLHTDMNYLENSPGIQALHCLEVDYGDISNDIEKPGESFFADGFYIGNWMRENHPKNFDILTSTPVKFQMHSQEYIQNQKILKVNSKKEIFEVHYNNRTMATFEGPPEKIKDFYESYKIFSEKLTDEGVIYRVNMKRGDVIIFNNRRILHGRNKYDLRETTRHFEGCYGDLDELNARLRVVLKSYC